MNEGLFFFHILLLIVAVLTALKLGRSALSLLCTLCFLLSNLFVTKQVELFSFTVTAADAYTIGGVFALNLLQEFFGKEEAKRQNLHTAFILTLFVLLSQIHLSYAPSLHDQTQSAFAMILSSTPRIVFSSFAVFLLVQRLEVELFSLLRRRLSLPVTILVSATICQGLDTILFSYLALYGLVHNLTHIIFVSYAIKLLAIFCMTPFSRLARRAA